jgi:hypothetical protein
MTSPRSIGVELLRCGVDGPAALDVFRHDLSVPRSLRAVDAPVVRSRLPRTRPIALGSVSVNSQNIIRCAFKHWEKWAKGIRICGGVNASATPRRARVSGGEGYSRSQWNGRFGAASGPFSGGPCRRATRPVEASKAAVCYVRSTSKPVELIGFDLKRDGYGRARSWRPRPLAPFPTIWQFSAFHVGERNCCARRMI